MTHSFTYEDIKNCLHTKQNVYVGGIGPCKIKAYDSNNNKVLLVNYKHTKLYDAYLKLVNECNCVFCKTDELIAFAKRMEEVLGENWNLVINFRIWADEEFFKSNEFLISELLPS